MTAAAAMLDIETAHGLKYSKLRPVWKYVVRETASIENPPAVRAAILRAGVSRYTITDDNGAVLAMVTATMTVAYAEYRFDGPSGPAIDTTDFMRASLFHDIWCQMIDEHIMPAEFQVLADCLMRHVFKLDHTAHLRTMTPASRLLAGPAMAFRRWYSFRAVRAYRSTVLAKRASRMADNPPDG